MKRAPNRPEKDTKRQETPELINQKVPSLPLKAGVMFRDKLKESKLFGDEESYIWGYIIESAERIGSQTLRIQSNGIVQYVVLKDPEEEWLPVYIIPEDPNESSSGNDEAQSEWEEEKNEWQEGSWEKEEEVELSPEDNGNPEENEQIKAAIEHELPKRRAQVVTKEELLTLPTWREYMLKKYSSEYPDGNSRIVKVFSNEQRGGDWIVKYNYVYEVARYGTRYHSDYGTKWKLYHLTKSNR